MRHQTKRPFIEIQTPFRKNRTPFYEILSPFQISGTAFHLQPLLCSGNKNGDKPFRIYLHFVRVKGLAPTPHGKLNSLYGERTTQRLQAMCNYFELTGKSRRV